MSYWDETDEYLRQHGGPPNCPSCGKTMFAEDDHGRFMCTCGRNHDTVTGLESPPLRPIPQVDTTGMSNEDKARIPPINRLESTPTEAEQRFFQLAARGPDCMDDPEYWKACEAIEEERKNAKGETP